MNTSTPLFILGPCVAESSDLLHTVAQTIQPLQKKLGIRVIFKASFDKANRTSSSSFRGLPFDQTCKLFQDIRSTYGLEFITDVHESTQIEKLVGVVDWVQVPAMLCRQTDLIAACVKHFSSVNIKRGQFLSPAETMTLYQKAKSLAAEKSQEPRELYITERGSSFGYNYLVNDFKAVRSLINQGVPMVFDATHSVQIPGGKGSSSDGESQLAPTQAYAAAAVGVRHFFLETHPDPAKALSDGPNMVPLDQIEKVLTNILRIQELKIS